MKAGLRAAAVLGTVAAVTFVDFRIAHVNSATAAFTYLLLILGLATRAGLRESITASFLSVLAYNFFFLPPIGTFTIADPQNWVALFVFLATAITTSQLSANARRKAEEARARQEELQRMYDFSRALMLVDEESGLSAQILRHIKTVFDTRNAWLFQVSSDSISGFAERNRQVDGEALRRVAASGEVWRDAEADCVAVPIRLGGPALGSLAVVPANQFSFVALQAIAQLIATAIERQRVQETASRMEAERQNEQLKSTLLDALAHEFKTPLTSVKAAATTLLSRTTLSETEQELTTIIDEEADRLTTLVSDAIELARIGSRPVVLSKGVYSVSSLISSAVAELRTLFEGRELCVQVDHSLPVVEVDQKLLELTLRQLLSNALKYSPPGSSIELTAMAQGESVAIAIVNAGPPIPKWEQERLFEKFYRGRETRARTAGTGMGLSIAREIVEAHGGRIWVENEPCRVRFAFTLPITDTASQPEPRVVA